MMNYSGASSRGYDYKPALRVEIGTLLADIDSVTSPYSHPNSVPNYLKWISRSGSWFLAITILISLLLMLAPLNPLALDVILAGNLAVITLILLMVLTLSTPLDLSVFPSLLLMTTLLRLGLNVASTRLILSQGHAGEIIETFGRYVSSGNIIVGVMIFSVLLIVQFVVVSKGSERVAEVAARFTLDGLPGKQMSIDADLRSGMITAEEARTLRSELLRESRLYGAMDGAMKFVKGDAIAGFIIVAINFAGGLAIGIGQRGLDFGRAIEVYTTLTMGDGLVSQIPSLMTALSAGLIVTRVTGQDRSFSLGEDLGQQLFANPKLVVAAAIVLAILGVVPGFPTGVFWTIAALIALFAFGLMLYARIVTESEDTIEKHVLATDKPVFACAEPFLLELSNELYAQFASDVRWKLCFDEMLPELQKRLHLDLGVSFPKLKIRLHNGLTQLSYQIRIYEVVVDAGVLYANHYQTRLDGTDTSCHEHDALTAHGTPILLHGDQRSPKTDPLRVYAPEEVLLRYVAGVMRRHVCDFVGIQEVRDILNHVEKLYPELVREIVPRLMSVQKLTDVIRRLVAESVSIRDFRLILETLSSIQPDQKSSIDLAELVRMGLKRQITHRYADAGTRLRCFALDTELEALIAKNIKRTQEDHFITLSPSEIQGIVYAVRAMAAAHDMDGSHMVILTQPEIRRYVRRILEGDFHGITVLSYQEIDSRIRIDVCDTISCYDDAVLKVV